MKGSAQQTGLFQSITEEDIKEAEEEPPPMLGEGFGPEQPTDNQGTARTTQHTSQPQEKAQPEKKEKVTDSAYTLTEEYQKLLSELTKFNSSEVISGLQVEREHFDTVEGNELVMLGIVRDHLSENPAYYSQLLEHVET